MKTKFITFTFLIVCLGLNSVFSQVEKFQAAYLFNFTRFIEWPSGFLPDNFIIGVLGNDPVVKELQSTASTKTIYGKKIDVKVFSNVESITPTHILFVPKASSDNVNSAAAKLGSQNTLLVSYSSKGIIDGSGINFILVDNKLQFEIKKANIIQNSLKVNSELENLAKKKY